MKYRMLILAMMIGVLATGCQNQEVIEVPEIEISEVTDEKKQKEEENEEAETEEVEEKEDIEETQENEQQESAEKMPLFPELKNREFYFGSGAGAWRTVLYVEEDGSFSGEYSDSNMGSFGEEYPNGTYCYCSFEGKFTKPIKVNDYTYSVGIAEISLKHEPGTEEIIDGILHCYSDPYGINEANSLLFYLPGAPMSELPQEYMDWVRMGIENAENDELPFYGIYNEKEQTGFSSYEILSPIDELMISTEKWSDTIKASLENDSLSQTEMNTKSYELYETWDATLNTLWTELKETLSEEEFQKLLDEQRAWISDKEQAVEEAGADVAGGSMQPLVMNLKAAELTEERVYELLKLL